MFTASSTTTKFQPQTSALFGAILIVAVACLLAFTGCGSSNNTPNATAAGTVINFGDAPNDQIIAFELTINAVTLKPAQCASYLRPSPARRNAFFRAFNRVYDRFEAGYARASQVTWDGVIEKLVS